MNDLQMQFDAYMGVNKVITDYYKFNNRHVYFISYVLQDLEELGYKNVRTKEFRKCVVNVLSSNIKKDFILRHVIVKNNHSWSFFTITELGMQQKQLMDRSLASTMEDLISINKTIDKEETNRSLLKHLNQSDSLTREHLATLYAIKEDLLVRLNREKRENYLK